MTSAAHWSLVASGVAVALATVVARAGSRRGHYRVYAAGGLGLAFWNLVAFALGTVTTEAATLHWAQVAWAAVFFLPVTFLHFLRLLLLGPGGHFRVWYVLTALAAAALFTSPWFIAGVRSEGAGWALVYGAGMKGLLALLPPITLLLALRYIAQAWAVIDLELKLGVVAVGAIFCAGVLFGGAIVQAIIYKIFEYFLEAPFGSFGLGATAAYAALVVYGLSREQWLDLWILLGRSLATLLRGGVLLAAGGGLLLAVEWAWPGLLGPAGFVGVLGGILLGAWIASSGAWGLLGTSANRASARLYGRRFDYLGTVRVLATQLSRESDLVDGLERVCAELRGIFKLGAAEVLYRDGENRLRLIPVRATETVATLEVRWARAMAVARTPAEGEAELHLPLRSVAPEPVGYLRLIAKGDRLRLHLLDMEALQELATVITRQIERDALRQTLVLRQVNEAKDRFLASINHEIRNPLNGLTGLLAILKEQDLQGRPAYLLETMSACAAQLAATMDNALDFASLSQRSAQAHESRFELGELIRGSGAHHEIHGGDSVRYHLAAEACWLRADAGKLRQIIGNYIGNALKYGQPPRAEVRAFLNPGRRDQTELTIEVSNPCPPESTRDMGEWFTAFKRGRLALESGVPGTGLGLAICQRLAHAMGGTVSARRSGGDVVFSVTVNVIPCLPPEARESERAADPPLPNPSRRVRVLAIEDESYNRLVLNHYLMAWGYEVEWAESGAAAEECFRVGRFDLIVMDWRLDDGDGAALLPRLRTLVPGGRLPPVIVLSAYATDEKEAQALAAGACAFLTKPLNPAALREMITLVVPESRQSTAFPQASPAAPTAETLRNTQPFPFLGVAAAPVVPGFEIPTASLLADLHADLELVRSLPPKDAHLAASKVHAMRGRARLLPPSELNVALADLERILSAPSEPAIRTAATEAVRRLLRQQETALAPDRAGDGPARP